MLNYFAMVDHLKKHYFVPILSAVLMAGCSPGANQTSSPENTTANANATPSIAQNAPPPAPSAQHSAEKLLAPAEPLLKPEVKPALSPVARATGNANIGRPDAAAFASAPKLVVPLSDIDFGKVAQGKSLTRNLVVRNAGKADLSIESVVPS